MRKKPSHDELISSAIKALVQSQNDMDEALKTYLEFKKTHGMCLRHLRFIYEKHADKEK